MNPVLKGALIGGGTSAVLNATSRRNKGRRLSSAIRGAIPGAAVGALVGSAHSNIEAAHRAAMRPTLRPSPYKALDYKAFSPKQLLQKKIEVHEPHSAEGIAHRIARRLSRSGGKIKNASVCALFDELGKIGW